MNQDNQLPPEDLHPLREHPLYRSGMAQANAGKWHLALQTFQSLQTLYPGDTELQQLLQEARMRGTLSQLQPKRSKRRRQISGPKRWALGLLIIVGVAVVGYLAYVLWLYPVLFQEYRLQQITQLRQGADELIAGGNYSQARQSLEELHQYLPNDPETVEMLHKVEQLEQAAQLYNQAQTLLQTESWDQAIETLTALQALDNQYRDSQELLRQAREFKQLDTQFQTAEQSLADGNLETAIFQFEAIHQANLSFKYDRVQKRLFDSHLAYGYQLLAESAANPEQISQALSQIELALRINPVDAEALNQRRLAENYLNALTSNVLDDRIDLLQALYNERSDSIEQDIARLLYAALLERADTSLENGNSDVAVEDVERAAKLPVEDPSAAQEKLSNLLAGNEP